MKKNVTLIAVLLISIAIIGCSGSSNEKQSLVFKPLSADELQYDDSSYYLPKDERWKEWKGMHDSCMGEQFPANAMFIQRSDSMRLGSIVNRHTMQVVKRLDFRMIGRNFFVAVSFITKPCYQVIPFDVSVEALFRKPVNLRLPAPYQKLDAELNYLMHNAVDNTVETGAWINGELTTGLGAILDTAQDAVSLEYKRLLVDSANMVLIRSASITNITFHIVAARPLSNGLLNALKQKPTANIENSDVTAQVFFISQNTFEISFTGIFQVMGQFMRCSLK